MADDERSDEQQPEQAKPWRPAGLPAALPPLPSQEQGEPEGAYYARAAEFARAHLPSAEPVDWIPTESARLLGFLVDAPDYTILRVAP